MAPARARGKDSVPFQSLRLGHLHSLSRNNPNPLSSSSLCAPATPGKCHAQDRLSDTCANRRHANAAMRSAIRRDSSPTFFMPLSSLSLPALSICWHSVSNLLLCFHCCRWRAGVQRETAGLHCSRQNKDIEAHILQWEISTLGKQGRNFGVKFYEISKHEISSQESSNPYSLVSQVWRRRTWMNRCGA